MTKIQRLPQQRILACHCFIRYFKLLLLYSMLFLNNKAIYFFLLQIISIPLISAVSLSTSPPSTISPSNVSLNKYPQDGTGIMPFVDKNMSTTNTSSMTTLIPEMLEITNSPLYNNFSGVEEKFTQVYCGYDIKLMNSEQITAFEVVLKLKTKEYGPNDGEPNVQTTVTVEFQQLNDNDNSDIPPSVCILNDSNNNSNDNNDDVKNSKTLQVIFTMSWSSDFFSLYHSEYVIDFKEYMNSIDTMIETISLLNSVGLRVDDISRLGVHTGYYSILPQQTTTMSPTKSSTISIETQTNNKEALRSGMNLPQPSSKKVDSASKQIVTIVIGGFLVIFSIGIIYYRASSRNNSTTSDEQQRHNLEQNIYFGKNTNTPATTMLSFDNNNDELALDCIELGVESVEKSNNSCNYCDTQQRGEDEEMRNNSNNNNNHQNNNNDHVDINEKDEEEEFSYLFPVTNQVKELFTLDSISQSQPPYLSLSRSSSSSTSEAEPSSEHVDELDQYKDPNLEAMRFLIESKICVCESMMSRAITHVLLMEDEDEVLSDLYDIVGNRNRNKFEIEASILCKTYDWLKRKEEDSTCGEREKLLQEIMIQMVTCVVYGILTPFVVVRILHECAVLLSFKLKQNIPATTILISGMSKHVETANVWKIFKNFGHIQHLSVSPNHRGFGFVRFKSSIATQKVMEKYRSSEIVVEDVAVIITTFSS